MGQLTDSSGNGHHLTEVGTLTHGVVSAQAKYRRGLGGFAAGTYLSQPNDALRVLGNLSCVGVWEITSLASIQVLVVRAGASASSADNAAYGLFVETNGRLNYTHDSGAGVPTTISSATGVVTTGNHFWTIIRDTTAKTVVIKWDGVIVINATYATNPTGGISGTFRIGQSRAGGLPLLGNVYQFNLWNDLVAQATLDQIADPNDPMTSTGTELALWLMDLDAIYWTGATPGNFSDARWSETSGVPGTLVEQPYDSIAWDGGGIGSCTVSSPQACSALTRSTAHTGGVVASGTGTITIAGNVDFASDGLFASPASLTGSAATLTGVITANLSVPGAYTGSVTIRGSASTYTLPATSSHSGDITLEQDADVADFSGATKPGIVAVNSLSGSQLPSTFDYSLVGANRDILGVGRIIFAVAGTPRVDLVEAANGGQIVSPANGIITRVLTLVAEGTWVKGSGAITFDAPSSILSVATLAQSLERLEVASGTLTMTLVAGTSAEGLYIRSGSTVNLNAQSFTISDPADGALLIEAGGQVTAGGAGATITCQIGDMNGVGPGGTLNLDAATPFTINASGSLKARYATMRNQVAGLVGGIATDCVNLGGNTGWTFVATPAVSTKLYIDATASDIDVPGGPDQRMDTTLDSPATNISFGTFGPTTTTLSVWAFSGPNRPSNADWPDGSWPVSIRLVKTDILLATVTVQLHRVSSTGTVIESSAESASQVMSNGSQTYTFPDFPAETWVAGSVTDRIAAQIRVTSIFPTTVSLRTNHADTWVTAPMAIADPVITTILPVLEGCLV